jgi:hypothetical protein
MSSVEPKTAERENLNDVKDLLNSRRYKEITGFSPYKKPSFTGEGEDLKEYIFDCESD